VATCRCAVCLAWNLAGAAHCQACGRLLASSTERAGVVASYHCPRCGSHLQAREYGNLSVEECDKCGGLFLAPTTLDRLVAARDMPTSLRLALPKREMKRETAVRYIACPTCGKSMNRKAFGRISGVVVDVCKSHGVWFDAGELGEVIRFVEQGGLERERERELAELAERERRVRQVEMSADRMDSPGIDFLSGNVSSPRIGQAHSAAEVLHFIADLWH
jgi:Zn-finger nucleic acid-binding protein